MVVKNAKMLDEKEVKDLEGLYEEYILDHYLRMTNNPREPRVSQFALDKRCKDYAAWKISEIYDEGRLVFVASDQGFIDGFIGGFIDCHLEGGLAVVDHIYVSYSEHLQKRRITLALYKALTDVLVNQYGMTKICARTYREDEELNRTLCSLGFEIDELESGASTIASERQI